MRLDLSAGQGAAARAALLERVPYFALTHSEVHSKKLEVQLTDFIVSEMKKEGSTHYRPEACQEPAEAGQESLAVPKGKAKNKRPSTESGTPSPKRKRLGARSQPLAQLTQRQKPKQKQRRKKMPQWAVRVRAAAKKKSSPGEKGFRPNDLEANFEVLQWPTVFFLSTAPNISLPSMKRSHCSCGV